MNTRQIIGGALGAVSVPGGSLCAVCGDSPFREGRSTKSVCGPAFVDYDLLQAAAPSVCEGCALMLGGKPSRENPPLRMGHFAVSGGKMERPDGERFVELLRDPPVDIQAMGWAISRQKHASLRCGPCSPGNLQIGCDHAAIEWIPGRDRPLLDAVSFLRRSATQAAIIEGAYAPHVITTLGPAEWLAAETVVRRYRPGLALEMVVALVRRPLLTPQEVNVAVPDEYRFAAEILYPLTQQSSNRRDDPIRFWSELLPRRLAAAASSSTVAEWLAYMLGAIHVEAFRPEVVEVLAQVDSLDGAAENRIMSVLRRDHRLVITYVRLIGQE